VHWGIQLHRGAVRGTPQGDEFLSNPSIKIDQQLSFGSMAGGADFEVDAATGAITCHVSEETYPTTKGLAAKYSGQELVANIVVEMMKKIQAQTIRGSK
jgi:hypothetical protein